MTHYSIFSLARNALTSHRNWPRAWRSPSPKTNYDVIIIGGGGHGLASAYYLVKNHGIKNVAVLERGWLGGGNTGRNTTTVRSNYEQVSNARFYDHSLKLYETMSQDLNYNIMFRQSGVLNLAHTDAQVESFKRRGNALHLCGIDNDFMTREEIARRIPILDCSKNARYPILGGLIQKRAGAARHDAVAWALARAASALGVDIIQNCEVTDIERSGNRVTGVKTSLGRINAGKVGIAVAGHTSQVCQMAGLEVPIESHLLQAMVSEPIKPCLHLNVSSALTHVYVKQTGKGDILIGGHLDGYNSYAQRGNFDKIKECVASVCALFPSFTRLRLMRTWAGVMDMTMDGAPIISKTPVDGLYLNGGWCYGGFKATPGSGWVFAHTIANDKPHPLNEAFNLERFEKGYMVDEAGAGPVPGHHGG